MYNKVNTLFSNRTRTNSMLVIALLFVLSVFAVGCDSTTEEVSAAGLSGQQTAVQETAVDTTVVDITAVNYQAANNRSTTVAVQAADGTAMANSQSGNAHGNSSNANSGSTHASAVDLVAQADSDITDEDAAALAFMREEEKLARDVYLTLYDVWGTAVFNNIASSEQTHMDAILMLMDHYDLADPASSNAVGQFANPDLQALYDQLVAVGSQSLPDALAVGAAIEEIDILDLDEYIEATTNPAILQVYGSLLAGSENHLRAFVPQLEQQSGESYTPQYMSQEQYATIMSAAGSNGHGNSGQSGSQGNSGNSDGTQECTDDGQGHSDSGQSGQGHSDSEQGGRGGNGGQGKGGANGQMHG